MTISAKQRRTNGCLNKYSNSVILDKTIFKYFLWLQECAVSIADKTQDALARRMWSLQRGCPANVRLGLKGRISYTNGIVLSKQRCLRRGNHHWEPFAEKTWAVLSVGGVHVKHWILSDSDLPFPVFHQTGTRAPIRAPWLKTSLLTLLLESGANTRMQAQPQNLAVTFSHCYGERSACTLSHLMNPAGMLGEASSFHNVRWCDAQMGPWLCINHIPTPF